MTAFTITRHEFDCHGILLIFLCISRYLYIYSTIPSELPNDVPWKPMVSRKSIWKNCLIHIWKKYYIISYSL